MSMKQFLLISSFVLFAGLVTAQEQVEITTGAGYVNDAYYNLGSGLVDTIARNSWDLAFSTSNFSVSILANHAAGVEVYTYSKGDTAAWAAFDTTGMSWNPLYNSLETRDEGAFSYNAKGHPDYGWGIYNMTTHNITGDSLYVIKTVDGAYKKLAIDMRGSIANTWEFRYANLDGSDEQDILLNSGNYNNKSFVYYHIGNNAVVDLEPTTETWDLLFTQYWDTAISHIVTGVQTNENHILVQEVKNEELDQATFIDYNDSEFVPGISTIGYDWKSINMTTFTYDVLTDVVYFLKKYGESDSSYYKIYFTAFSGSSEGKYTFMQEELSAPVSISDWSPIRMLEVYPNPASDQLNLVFDFSEDTRLHVIDIAGRPVLNYYLYKRSGFGKQTIDISQLNPGIYFLHVEGGAGTEVVRFIKK